MTKALPFTAASQVLQRLIEQYGLQGPMAEYRLREHWAEVVGDQIAAHAQPDQIRFHKLYLSVDSPAWMQELAFLKPTLLEKVNGALRHYKAEYTVAEITLRLGSSAPIPEHSNVTRPNHPKQGQG
jgi:predicted nucleic acid-binding Zn ribbon protein